MSIITIALLQMTACGSDQAANLAKGETFCRQAQALGADIALFPEMWNIGYTSFDPTPDNPSDVWRAPELWDRAETGETPALSQARTRWQAQAVGPNDPFVTHFRSLAQ